MAIRSPDAARRSAALRLLTLSLCASVFLLAACKNDTSLYEEHRGKYPAEYKAKVRAAIEKGWPEPRKFRVVAITEPTEGFLVAKNYWQPKTYRDYYKYGAWLPATSSSAPDRQQRGGGLDRLLCYPTGSASASAGRPRGRVAGRRQRHSGCRTAPRPLARLPCPPAVRHRLRHRRRRAAGNCRR
jgi:hypothetical protein